MAAQLCKEKMKEPEFMLASEGAAIFPDRIYQPKYDGSRAILSNLSGKLKLINRRGTDKLANYPEFKCLQLPENTVLDGEVAFICRPPFKCDFYGLLQRENLKDPFMQKLLMKQVPATFVAFDILFLRGQDLRNLPLRTRFCMLHAEFNWYALSSNSLSGNPGSFRVCEVFNDEDTVQALIKEHQLEGMVIKNLDSRYVAGRSDNWVKQKVKAKEWFWVRGFKSKNRTISALYLEDNEQKFRGYVNFTLKEAEWLPFLRPLVLPGEYFDHEKMPYMRLQAHYKALVEYCPASIELLREPILLKLEAKNGSQEED